MDDLKKLFENQEKIQNCTCSKTMDEPKELEPLGENETDWDRNATVAKESVEDANFKCELDPNHLTFTNRRGTPYMEAHHLIPMAVQENFKYSIDVKANLVSLCPNCHRRLHSAIMEEKKDLLKTLYDNRICRLNKCNLDLTLEELLTYYD